MAEAAPDRQVLRVSGVVLPAREHHELFVVGDRVTYEPVAEAVEAARGWIVPGLVDAHCHIGLDENGPIDAATCEAQARTDRDAGALLVRDAGSATDTRWIDDRPDLPEIIRAGRHLARPRRYLRNFAHEIEPEELPAFVAQEADRGDGWVKLVGDWIDRDIGDLSPCWPREALEQAMTVAHDHGARVTAHVFGEDALPDLLESGIDCLEHGTGLSPTLVETMAAHGVALVPTARQLDNFPGYAAAGEARFPSYAKHMRALHARRVQTIMGAYEAGVPIFAGTDAGGVLPHGLIAEEVAEMAAYGMPAEYALGAASWRAREWLGRPAFLAEGDRADFVVYDDDPVANLDELRRPRLIVLRGRVVSP